MKPKFLFLFLCMAFVLAGCSPFLPEKEPVENVSHILAGHSMEIENTDSRLVLVDNNSSLAADGLYYISWGMGDTEPYENSDGDTVDLYDASLYLLLGESRDSAAAQNNTSTWLEAARINYEVSEEEEVICGGQTYTLLTYNCVNEDNPYERGVSAFASIHGSSVCVELTCRKAFQEDLKSILINFLNHCSYTADPEPAP